MKTYCEELTLLNRDVNMFRRLRTSRLFELLQEVSIRHTEMLGAGRKLTLDKGILWVVTLQRAEITRIPEYDEQIIIETWPGETMHLLFPRYYRMLDRGGNVLMSASALWALVDCQTRRLASPDKYGIAIDGFSTGNEISQPLPPMQMETDHRYQFEVPFSYVDLNGHMNNTRYFDLAEDLIPAVSEGRLLKTICIEYASEICMGETVDVIWGQNGSRYYIAGQGNKKHFRMSLEYQ